MATASQSIEAPGKKSHRIIRNIYLYLVAMIGLITLVIGLVGIINNVLQNYVFQVNDNIYSTPVPYPGMKNGGCDQSYPDPTDTTGKKLITPTAQEVQKCDQVLKDQQEQNRRNNIGREFSISIAQIMIGFPLWLYHWGVIQAEYKRKEEETTKKK
ncbi:MAG: hypothetical protein WC843_03010 [Candidatus Gracilibacteria bacterium]|jgi:hypothetical protein